MLLALLGMTTLTLHLTMMREVSAHHGSPHGTVDQSFEGPFGSTTLIWKGTMGQSFRPSKNLLRGVEVFLVNQGAHYEDVMLLVRSGSIDGPIININAPTDVPIQRIPAGMKDSWVYFEFCWPLDVIPEQTYIIQLVSAGGAPTEALRVMWWEAAPGADYPRGTGISGGVPGSADWGFRTYYAPQATNAWVWMTDWWVSSSPEGPRISTVARGTPFYVNIKYTVGGISPAGGEVFHSAMASIRYQHTTHVDSCSVPGGEYTTSIEFMPLESTFPTGISIVFIRAWVVSRGGQFNLDEWRFTITVT